MTMSRTRVFASGVAVTAFAALLLLGALAGTALGAPPANTALPAISPAMPEVTKPATATTGTWSSEAPAHWRDWKTKTAFTAGEKVAVTAKGNPISVSATISGLLVTLSCETEVSSASIENPSGGGNGVGSAKIGFKSCQVLTPSVGCKAETTATYPSKMALSPTKGKAPVTFTPAEGTTFAEFNFSGCSVGALNGLYKLTGSLTGAYSNTVSHIEFDATTVGNTLKLRNQKAIAVGSIGVEKAAGGAIAADSLTYGYAWKRCTGAVCTEIPGATTSTYTPAAADYGKTLKVSVTATDVNGNTTATSNASGTVTGTISWYACSETVGTGVFKDPNCTEAGSPANYSWLAPAGSEPLSTSGGLVKIVYTLSGIGSEIQCAESAGQGSIANGPARIQGYTLTLNECWPTKPMGSGCTIAGQEIALNLTGHSAAYPPALTMELASTASFHMEGCSSGGFNGEYKVTGSFPAQVNNGESKMTTSHAESWGKLKVKGVSASIEGAFNMAALESEVPVKLDVEP